MSVIESVKAWWSVYIVGLFKPPVEPEDGSAEEWLARKFPLESEWDDE